MEILGLALALEVLQQAESLSFLFSDYNHAPK
jgi:hypothetical protein